MNKHNIACKLSVGGAAALALALGACSSVPADNPALMDAQSAYAAADNNPRTRELAAAELMQAKTALDRADRAHSDRAKPQEVERLAYEAKQRVAIANEVASRKRAEQRVTEANAERDKIRLEARTREADQARQTAEVAQVQAAAAQGQAMIAQSQAEAAKREAENAQSVAAQTPLPAMRIWWSCCKNSMPSRPSAAWW